MAGLRTEQKLREVPVRVFRTPDRVTVAAAMPGLLPEDILVEVGADGHLLLHGDRPGDQNVQTQMQSGALTEPREILIDEWGVDDYHRELDLPNAVDGELATVTYGNGVLVAALPIVERTRPARLTLERVGPFRGERVGSTGHPIQPISTEEHWAAAHAMWTARGEDSDPPVGRS
jgi:HSP20 family molecular chaperone IbpA